MCRLVTNGRRPLVQVVKRLSEAEGQPSTVPLVRSIVECNRRNGVFILNDNSIAFADERLSPNDVSCRVLPSSAHNDFYTVPCKSTLFNVSFVTERSALLPRKRKTLTLAQLTHKVACLPHNDGFVLLPLCHGNV